MGLWKRAKCQSESIALNKIDSNEHRSRSTEKDKEFGLDYTVQGGNLPGGEKQRIRLQKKE